jgi:hypothetical protein
LIVGALSALSVVAEMGVYYLEGPDVTEPIATGLEFSLGVFVASFVVANAAHAFASRGASVRSEPRYVNLDILDPSKKLISSGHPAPES